MRPIPPWAGRRGRPPTEGMTALSERATPGDQRSQPSEQEIQLRQATILFVLPVLIAGLAYPLRVTIVVGAIDIAAFLTVARVSGDDFAYSGLVAFGLLCASAISGFEARNQARRREELAGAAAALRVSEEVSRLQARQQQEVARFGQRALSGEDIDEL